jgi:biotin transport system substrate-specific component
LKSKVLGLSYVNNSAKVIFTVAFTTVGAKLYMHLPFTPVPVTWQTAGVLFAGLTLGSEMGFLSQLLYLGVGLTGLPVFSAGGGVAYFFNPMGTGGYLVAFPIAAYVIGKISESGTSTSHWRQFIACLAGVGVIYLIGSLWLGAYMHIGLLQAILMGSIPFLFWDIAKAVVVIAVCGKAGHLKSPRD